MTSDINKVSVKTYRGDGKFETVVSAKLVNGIAVLEGEAEFINNLNTGLRYVLPDSEKTVFPKDGIPFLMAMLREFRSPHLFAEETV